MAGRHYTIADMAIWPWYGGLARANSYGAAEFLSVDDYKNVLRWADAIAARPGCEAWTHRQQDQRRSCKSVARAPRRGAILI